MYNLRELKVVVQIFMKLCLSVPFSEECDNNGERFKFICTEMLVRTFVHISYTIQIVLYIN